MSTRTVLFSSLLATVFLAWSYFARETAAAQLDKINVGLLSTQEIEEQLQVRSERHSSDRRASA